jgi:hypothetical protein
LPPAYTDYHTADPWPRCDFGKTLHSEGKCQRLREVQLDGSVLCVPYAKLLRLEVRVDIMLVVMCLFCPFL